MKYLILSLLFLASLSALAETQKEICQLGINTLAFNKSLDPVMQNSLSYLDEQGAETDSEKEWEKLHKLKEKFKKDGASAKYCKDENFLEHMDHFPNLGEEYHQMMTRCLKEKKPLAFLAKSYGLSKKHIKSFKELKEESLIQLDINNPVCPIHTAIKQLDFSFIDQDTKTEKKENLKRICIEFLTAAQAIYQIKNECLRD